MSINSRDDKRLKKTEKSKIKRRYLNIAGKRVQNQFFISGVLSCNPSARHRKASWASKGS